MFTHNTVLRYRVNPTIAPHSRAPHINKLASISNTRCYKELFTFGSVFLLLFFYCTFVQDSS
jgi:hypothetical protein